MLHTKYSSEVEETMKKFYDTLNEKDKRRYAGIETMKLAYGGQSYICKILGCDPDTVKKGREELEGELSIDKRIRTIGGGRTKIIETTEKIDEVFLEILRTHTAGNPMDEKVKYTNLNRVEISKRFAERNMEVSEHIVKQLLDKHGYGERKMQKTKTMKEVENRNEQFENIAEIRAKYENSENPIISIDVKKKRK